MNVGSLFSGVGGFDLGLERAGFELAWHSEIEPYACAVLRKHWPGVPNHGDITRIRADAVEPVDVICGGFPCQDLSVAGKGAGIDGERSGLWREYARLVREIRPRWVVVENSPALRTRGYDRVADDLENAGYTVQAFVVGADDIGAPHRRKRVWIVAHSDEVRQQQQRRGGLLDRERPAQRDDAGGCAGAGVFADAERDELRHEQGRRCGTSGRGAAEPGDDGENGLAAHTESLRWQSEGERRASQFAGVRSTGEGWATADAHGPRLEISGCERSDDESQRAPAERACEQWRWDRAPEPTIRRVDDGLPRGLDANRRPRLAALGNALLPQIAEAIGRAIMRVERA